MSTPVEIKIGTCLPLHCQAQEMPATGYDVAAILRGIADGLDAVEDVTPLRLLPDAGDTKEPAPCKICGAIPPIPKLWTDGSGNHSVAATIACGCGVQVSILVGQRYVSQKGDTGWDMIAGNWELALEEALDKWNHAHECISCRQS